MRRTLALVFASVMLAAAAAAAPAAKPAKKSLHKQLDKNGNGVVSAAEAKSGAKERFKSLDKDKDGKLSADELVAGHMEWFNQQDSNSDGTVALAESIDFMCGPAPDKKGAGSAHTECVMVHTAVYKAADENGDGKLTKEEYEKYSRQQHAKVDKNQDGLIIVQESFAILMPTYSKPGKEVTKD
ncbi:MAG: hypothetical protein PHU21_07965 [Elusimicrobia bacterium]|nr:hypothetical protein [Elusimicrobiota bacterium]